MFSQVMSSQTTPAGIEIDFLAVGQESKSGDAIAFRYGNLQGPRAEQTVVIIDGGTKESGEVLATHIQQYYHTSDVDLAVLSHPDMDHVSGLIAAVEKLNVGTVLMHQPWNHSAYICNLFQNGRLTPSGISTKLRAELSAARELETLAKRRNIKIVEPFAGVHNSVLTVLGPTLDYYRLLLADFEATPEPISGIAALFARSSAVVSDVISYVGESLHIETLTDDGVTSSENNSSVILLVQVPGYRFLFTGDAGIPALSASADYAARAGIDLRTLDGWQVPHHGSKRNVGPTILNRIKGTRAFISAATDGGPKHPAKKVTNALIRRGSAVYATRGKHIRDWHNAPPRAGWDTSAEQIPFYERVEA